ncbi:flagellar biosynthetic protein FliR [Desulfogranum mediterraneum]|uniref:flagellar biosynthetic protein FliR n=1 Tax=Desulfogranum mediterraneum TaxID=160661 RepID=UPI0004020A5A|nr:flagellar biosynthetic protein FliR [Desulfogranum mediterraneum]
MDLQLIPLGQFQDFLICLSRVIALIAAIPVFGGSQLAGRIKVGIAVITALLLFPLMAPYTPKPVGSILELGLLLVNEVLLGALLGLVAQLIFAGVGLGGSIIGYQMGFAAANIFDPQTTQQLSLMSQFINILSLLIFLSLDIHYFFFHAILESYILLPPGGLNLSGEAIPRLMELASEMFILGVKFSAPILSLLLISNLVLGILARVFPQLNVFMLSFPMNIGIAFLVIGLTLNIVLLILRREFDTMMNNIIQLFTLLRLP